MVPVNVFIELLCFIGAFFYLKKEKEQHWYAFVWFMLFITLLELAGWAMRYLLTMNNHWLYNIHMVVEVFFVAWILHRFFKSMVDSKPWILTGLVVFVISYTIESIARGFVKYNEFTASLTAVLFVIAAGCYFYCLLKSEEYVELLRHPPFWIITGIFLFYFGSTAANIFFEELKQLNLVYHIPLRYFIFPVLNAMLYGCWIYGFRCKYLQNI
jgi:hypothetical protein